MVYITSLYHIILWTTVYTNPMCTHIYTYKKYIRYIILVSHITLFLGYLDLSAYYLAHNMLWINIYLYLLLLFQECLEFFNIPESQSTHYFLMDKRWNLIHYNKVRPCSNGTHVELCQELVMPFLNLTLTQEGIVRWLEVRNMATQGIPPYHQCSFGLVMLPLYPSFSLSVK